MNGLSSQVASLQSQLSSALTEANSAAKAAQETASQAFNASKDASGVASEAYNLAAAAQEAASKGDAAAAQAAADAAKALAAANSANEAAAKAADAAIASAKEAAIKAAQEEVAKLKEEIDKSSSASSDDLKKLEEDLAKIKSNVEAVTGKIADAVTSVELLTSYYGNRNNIPWYGINTSWSPEKAKVSTTTSYNEDGEPVTVPYGWVSGLRLLMNGSEKANVFSKGVKNAITFVNGTQFQTPNSLYVRVSPTNAVLTPEQVSFVNSLGENIDEYVKVTNVERVNTLLTRADGQGGIWKIDMELVKYDKDFIAATMQTNPNGTWKSHTLFAVAVNNTTAADRQVISAYDVAFEKSDYTPESYLNFVVDETPVYQINNRATAYSRSFDGNYNDAQQYTELVWKASTTQEPTPAVAPNKNNVVEGDNRSYRDVYPVIEGVPFTVTLGDIWTYADGHKEFHAPENVRAMYVTLDDQNAVESAPSELNAWNSYKYEGLNTVVEAEDGIISIDLKVESGDNSKVLNDIIGFRVYAVNFDGTLVDPDGRAFYVQVGDETQDLSGTATKIVPTSTTIKNVYSELVGIDKISVKNVASLEWTTDADLLKTKPSFHAQFLASDKKTVLFTTEETKAPDAETLAKVAYVRTYVVDAWTAYEDGKTYNGTLSLKGSAGHVLATLNISFTKEMPGIPAGYAAKANQIVEGIYNAYLVPDEWAAGKAENGTMPMLYVFNLGKNKSDVTSEADKYEFTFAAAARNAKKAIVDNEIKAGDKNPTLVVAKEFIDGKTKHATTVSYNYGKITSKVDAKTKEPIDYIVEVDKFETIFTDIYDNNTYKWDWATLADLKKYGKVAASAKALPEDYLTEVVYGTETFEVNLDYILGTSSRDSEYNALLSEPYEESLEVVSATITTASGDTKGYEEYYKFNKVDGTKLVFDRKSDATNPTADVPSVLTITVKDSYGHTNHKVIISGLTIKQR